jgi:hypothetical protein
LATRVPGGGVSRSPYGPTWVGGKDAPETVGDAVQDNLFGKPKPRRLDLDPESAALMARLHAFRKKLARLAGDREDDYDLTLASGTIASIDRNGLIYVGRDFLFSWAHEPDAQVGVIAHEIGHRPKRWAEYRQDAPRTREEMEDLCRLEETRADYFCGWSMAQLGLTVEPVCQFLSAVATHPHPEYFPADVRVETIREAFGAGERKVKNMRKFFPELARLTSAKEDLGSG